MLHQPDSFMTTLLNAVHCAPVQLYGDAAASCCPSFWLAVVVAELHGPDDVGAGVVPEPDVDFVLSAAATACVSEASSVG